MSAKEHYYYIIMLLACRSRMAIDLTCAAEGYSVHRAMQETGVAPTCRTGVQDDTFVILGSQGQALHQVEAAETLPPPGPDDSP